MHFVLFYFFVFSSRRIDRLISEQMRHGRLCKWQWEKCRSQWESTAHLHFRGRSEFMLIAVCQVPNVVVLPSLNGRGMCGTGLVHKLSGSFE